MKKLESKGFSVVEVVVVIVILGLVGGLGWYIRDKHQSKKNSTPSVSTDSPAPAPAASPEPAKDPYDGWKTFESKLGSGLSFKYPADWIAVLPSGEPFKNNAGGVMSTVTLRSTNRGREPGGDGAPNPASNTYMCVSFDEYGGEWAASPDWLLSLSEREEFKTTKGVSLSLDTYKRDSSMLSIVRLAKDGKGDVSTKNGYWVAATAEFNCVQADSDHLKSSKEDITKRTEFTTAKLILKSIAF